MWDIATGSQCFGLYEILFRQAQHHQVFLRWSIHSILFVFVREAVSYGVDSFSYPMRYGEDLPARNCSAMHRSAIPPAASGITIYRELITCSARPLAKRFVLVTGDMVGARAEIGALPLHERPLVLEKPFSTLDVRSALAAVSDQALAH